MIHLRFSLAAVTVAFAAAACGSTDTTATASSSSGTGGSTGTTSSTSGAGGSTPGKEPVHHRASAAPCTAPRDAENQGNAQGGCLKDADCTTGANGRCVAFLGKPSICSYDACKADAECGSASVCDCRNSDNFGANTCFQGGCQVDADCGAAGYCSPSAVAIGTDCYTGIPQGSFGYFCHTAADTCVDDADCTAGPAGSQACLFQVDTTRWACVQLMCVG